MRRVNLIEAQEVKIPLVRIVGFHVVHLEAKERFPYFAFQPEVASQEDSLTILISGVDPSDYGIARLPLCSRLCWCADCNGDDRRGYQKPERPQHRH